MCVQNSHIMLWYLDNLSRKMCEKRIFVVNKRHFGYGFDVGFYSH